MQNYTATITDNEIGSQLAISFEGGTKIGLFKEGTDYENNIKQLEQALHATLGMVEAIGIEKYMELEKSDLGFTRETVGEEVWNKYIEAEKTIDPVYEYMPIAS